MGLIYRYKDTEGNIIYVGQVSGDELESVRSRVSQHKNCDAWARNFNGIIEVLRIPAEYKPLTQATTDTLETHFINKFYSEKLNNKNHQVGQGLIQFIPDELDNAKWVKLPNKKKPSRKSGPEYLKAPYTNSKMGALISKTKEYTDIMLSDMANICIIRKFIPENEILPYNEDLVSTDIKNGEMTISINLKDSEYKDSCIQLLNSVPYVWKSVLGNILSDSDKERFVTYQMKAHFTTNEIYDSIIDEIDSVYDKAMQLIRFLNAHYPDWEKRSSRAASIRRATDVYETCCKSRKAA